VRGPRPVLLLPVVAVLGIAVTSTQAAPPGVSGGGFHRDGSGRAATKAMLTIDARPGTPSTGRAAYTVNRPGQRPVRTALSLTCVVVSGRTAYASGTDSSGARWYVKVVDNGQPGRNDQFGVSSTGDTLLGVVPVPDALSSTCNAGSVGTRPLQGGNFHVVG